MLLTQNVNIKTWLIGGLFIIAFFLRFYPALTKPPVLDEEEKIFIANQISINPQNPNFPIVVKFIPHSLFSVYFVKLGFILFGESVGAGRFIFVLLGTLSLYFIYRMVKEQLGEKIGVVALIFLVFDQFHIGESSQIREEAPLLFFSALAIYFFFKALHGNKKNIYGVALSIGFGYLCKETAIFLFFTFIFFLLIRKEYRFWFRLKQFWLAVFLICLVVFPYLLWGIKNGFSNYSDLNIGLGLSLRVIYLYFAEILTWLTELKIFTVFGGTSNEFPFAHWVSGVLIFFSFFYSFQKRIRENEVIFFCILMFSVIVFSASFIDSAIFDSQWRASLTIFPGLILSANALVSVGWKNRSVKLATVALIVYCISRSFYFISLPEHCYAVSNNALCSFYFKRAVEYLRKGETEKAIQRCAWIKRRCHDKKTLTDAGYLIQNKKWPKEKFSPDVDVCCR